MDVEELKIENFVFDKKNQRIVKIHGIEPSWDEVWVNYANGSGVYKLKIEEVEPIPLAEEWLTKFGFDSEGFRQYDWLNYGMFAVKGLSDDYVLFQGFFKRDSELTSVKYVHQLQNIYYALSGDELKLGER